MGSGGGKDGDRRQTGPRGGVGGPRRTHLYAPGSRKALSRPPLAGLGASPPREGSRRAHVSSARFARAAHGLPDVRGAARRAQSTPRAQLQLRLRAEGQAALSPSWDCARSSGCAAAAWGAGKKPPARLGLALLQGWAAAQDAGPPPPRFNTRRTAAKPPGCRRWPRGGHGVV